MKTKIEELRTNPQKMSQEIEEFIRQNLQALGREGAAVALSGGLDSAVVAMLAVRSLGSQKVHLVNLPERDSNPIHRQHARQLAQELGIELQVVDITSALRAAGAYRSLPLWLVPSRRLRGRLVTYGREKLIKHNDERIFLDRMNADGKSWMARGNSYGMSKHRMRMLLIYQYAEVCNLMVVGAANHTEVMTGTYCKWGVDHCADIMPVMHLYRSQLEQVADYIHVPDYIRTKPSDPDLYPTRIDKGEFLGGFEKADQVLFNLENSVAKEALVPVYGQKMVEQLEALYQASAHMREAPFHL